MFIFSQYGCSPTGILAGSGASTLIIAEDDRSAGGVIDDATIKVKITAKFQHYFLFKILGFPGLMLQRITTQTPNDDQLEVAINALKHAFGDQLKKYEGKEFNAEAVG